MFQKLGNRQWTLASVQLGSRDKIKRDFRFYLRGRVGWETRCPLRKNCASRSWNPRLAWMRNSAGSGRQWTEVSKGAWLQAVFPSTTLSFILSAQYLQETFVTEQRSFLKQRLLSHSWIQLNVRLFPKYKIFLKALLRDDINGQICLENITTVSSSRRFTMNTNTLRISGGPSVKELFKSV